MKQELTLRVSIYPMHRRRKAAVVFRTRELAHRITILDPMLFIGYMAQLGRAVEARSTSVFDTELLGPNQLCWCLKVEWLNGLISLKLLIRKGRARWVPQFQWAGSPEMFSAAARYLTHNFEH